MLLASESLWGTVEGIFGAVSWLWAVVLGTMIISAVVAFVRAPRAWQNRSNPFEQTFGEQTFGEQTSGEHPHDVAA